MHTIYQQGQYLIMQHLKQNKFWGPLILDYFYIFTSNLIFIKKKQKNTENQQMQMQFC